MAMLRGCLHQDWWCLASEHRSWSCLALCQRTRRLQAIEGRTHTTSPWLWSPAIGSLDDFMQALFFIPSSKLRWAHGIMCVVAQGVNISFGLFISIIAMLPAFLTISPFSALVFTPPVSSRTIFLQTLTPSNQPSLHVLALGSPFSPGWKIGSWIEGKLLGWYNDSQSSSSPLPSLTVARTVHASPNRLAPTVHHSRPSSNMSHRCPPTS